MSLLRVGETPSQGRSADNLFDAPDLPQPERGANLLSFEVDICEASAYSHPMRKRAQMAAKAIHSMIRVLDETRSVDFYRRAIGLKIADRLAFDDFTSVYLSNSAADFELELTINRDRAKPYELGDGYGHIAFVVDDIEAERARFEREGLIPLPLKTVQS